jgi:hypothetical protein
MEEKLVQEISDSGSNQTTSSTESVTPVTELSEIDVVMCHRYPSLACLDPQYCPEVYATCWRERIWNR